MTTRVTTRPAPRPRPQQPGLARWLGARWLTWMPRGKWAVLFCVGLGVLGGAGLAARLFAGGAIGLSDNGDGTRLMCSLGVREGNPYNTPTSQYVYLTWYDHKWWGETCGALGSGEPYQTSELWIAQLAKWLTPVFGFPGGLDLRVLGIVFCLLVALLLTALAAWLPLPAVPRAVTVAAVWLIVADGGFAGYFVSAYSEPAALVGILALLIAVLLYWRAPYVRWWTLLAVGLTAMFTITAKTQTASFLVAVIPLALLRHSWGATLRTRMRARTPQRQAWPLRFVPLEWVCSRWPALLLCGALLGGTVAYLDAQPERFTVQNDYAAVFVEMLPHSPHPAQDLHDLGLPTSWVSSSGKLINDPTSVARDLGFADFTDHASPLDTTLIYLKEPNRLWGMLGRGLDGMGVYRPGYIHSYPPSSGRPNTDECRVCVWQSIWEGTAGNWGPSVVLLTLLAIVLCARLAVTRRPRGPGAVGVLGLFVALSMMAQFWAVMLSEGASDLYKHLVFTNFLAGLLAVITLVAGYLLLTTPRRLPRAPA
jgi:hypothetical protein